jgi:hypothetical protein
MQNGLRDQSLPSIFLFNDEDITKVSADLRKLFEEKIQTRHTYLHGTWFIGWASEGQQDFSEISGFKGTASPAKGLGLKQLATSVSELHQRVEVLEEINDAFRRLFGCIIGGFPVAKNFLRYEGRYVSPDTARKRGWKISDS